MSMWSPSVFQSPTQRYVICTCPGFGTHLELQEDEEKINHRIPHRFEPLTNLSANWCCHCGYMLPFGRRNAKRCSECGISCHANCAHLVPDFCGMPMETANQLLRDWRDIRSKQQIKPPPRKTSPPQAAPPDLSGQLDHMRLDNERPPSLSLPSSPPTQYQQLQQQQPPQAGGRRVPVPAYPEPVTAPPPQPYDQHAPPPVRFAFHLWF